MGCTLASVDAGCLCLCLLLEQLRLLVSSPPLPPPLLLLLLQAQPEIRADEGPCRADLSRQAAGVHAGEAAGQAAIHGVLRTVRHPCNVSETLCLNTKEAVHEMQPLLLLLLLLLLKCC
jgi:hypothetical protein